MMTRMHWRLECAEHLPAGDDWLSAAEREVLGSTAVPKRRREWRLGRWTTKRLLDDVRGWPYVELLRASDGAPVASIRGDPLSVSLSLSHRDDLALSCVTDVGIALGCDLERIEPRRDVFVADYFTRAEQEAVAATRSDLRACMVTAIWSAKESALKAVRSGLRRDTRSVEVRLGTDGVTDEWIPLEVADEVSGASLRGGWWVLWGDTHRYVITYAADRDLEPVRSGGICPGARATHPVLGVE